MQGKQDQEVAVRSVLITLLVLSMMIFFQVSVTQENSYTHLTLTRHYIHFIHSRNLLVMT